MNGGELPIRVGMLKPGMLERLNNNNPPLLVESLLGLRGNTVIKVEAEEINRFITDMLGIDKSYLSLPSSIGWSQSLTCFSRDLEAQKNLRETMDGDGHARVMNKMSYNYRQSSLIPFDSTLSIHVWRVLTVHVNELANQRWVFPKPHKQSAVYPSAAPYVFLMIAPENVEVAMRAVLAWMHFRPDNPPPPNTVVTMNYWQHQAALLLQQRDERDERIAQLQTDVERMIREHAEARAAIADRDLQIERLWDRVRTLDALALFSEPTNDILGDCGDHIFLGGFSPTGPTQRAIGDDEDEDVAWRARTFGELLQVLYEQEAEAEGKKPFVLGVTAEHGGGQQPLPTDHATAHVQHDHKYVISLRNQGDTDLYLTVVIHTVTSKGKLTSLGEDLHWIDVEPGEFSPWLTVGGTEVDMRTEVDDNAFAISLADIKERIGGDLKGAALQCFVVQAPTEGRTTPRVWRWDATFHLK